jgi:hypothetical protein
MKIAPMARRDGGGSHARRLLPRHPVESPARGGGGGRVARPRAPPRPGRVLVLVRAVGRGCRGSGLALALAPSGEWRGGGCVGFAKLVDASAKMGANLALAK